MYRDGFWLQSECTIHDNLRWTPQGAGRSLVAKQPLILLAAGRNCTCAHRHREPTRTSHVTQKRFRWVSFGIFAKTATVGLQGNHLFLSVRKGRFLLPCEMACMLRKWPFDKHGMSHSGGSGADSCAWQTRSSSWTSRKLRLMKHKGPTKKAQGRVFKTYKFQKLQVLPQMDTAVI